MPEVVFFLKRSQNPHAGLITPVVFGPLPLRRFNWRKEILL